MPDDAIDEKSKGTLSTHDLGTLMPEELNKTSRSPYTIFKVDNVHVSQALQNFILIVSVETNWQGETFIPSFKRIDKNTNILI